MFAGHLAAGLVLKKMERRINLGWLFFAALFHDFLLGILILLGLEKIHIPANFAQTHYLTFTFPYSHGLTASIIWSALAFGITYVVLPRWTRILFWIGLCISLKCLCSGIALRRSGSACGITFRSHSHWKLLLSSLALFSTSSQLSQKQTSPAMGSPP